MRYHNIFFMAAAEQRKTEQNDVNDLGHQESIGVKNANQEKLSITMKSQEVVVNGNQISCDLETTKVVAEDIITLNGCHGGEADCEPDSVLRSDETAVGTNILPVSAPDLNIQNGNVSDEVILKCDKGKTDPEPSCDKQNIDGSTVADAVIDRNENSKSDSIPSGDDEVVSDSTGSTNIKEMEVTCDATSLNVPNLCEDSYKNEITVDPKVSSETDVASTQETSLSCRSTRSRSSTPTPAVNVHATRSRSSTPNMGETSKAGCNINFTDCKDSQSKPHVNNSGGSKKSEMCSDSNNKEIDSSNNSLNDSSLVTQNLPSDNLEAKSCSSVDMDKLMSNLIDNKLLSAGNSEECCPDPNIQRVKTSEERSASSSLASSARNSEERTVLSPQSLRSSEERSLDSLDSAKSKLSQSSGKSSIPRARKSMNKPSNISSEKKSLAPLENLTVKLPDFDNPIQIDSRTLEKINRLGKMESKNRSSLGKSDKHFMKKNTPTKKPAPTLVSASPVHPKIQHKRRKFRRRGTYKLPNELRKGKFSKKKGDKDKGTEHGTSDHKSEVQSTDQVNIHEEFPENMEFETSAIQKSHIKSQNSDFHSNSEGYDSSDSDNLETENFDLSEKDVSQENCDAEHKNVYEIFKLTPKSKNTLGSIRPSKTSLCAKKIEKIGRDHKGKTIEDYLVGGKNQKSSQETENAVKKLENCDTYSPRISASQLLGDRHCLRKRKITGDGTEVEMGPGGDTAVPLTELQQSGKKQRLEDGKRNLLAVLSSPPNLLLNQPGLRSILPKTLDPSNQTRPATTITVPKLTVTEASSASAPLVTSVGSTTQLILLTKPGISTNNTLQNAITISQPFFNTHLGLMAKPPLKASDSLLVASPFCAKPVQQGNDVTQPSPQQLKAPVLNRLLNQNMESMEDHESEKEDNSSDSLPSSLSYPVTPPKTPDDQRSEDSCSAPPGPTPPDKDIIPLCCCKINGASFRKLGSSVTYCQSLDSIDGKVMGCCNKVTGSQLVRPGVKIPFMALCEAHRKRLRLHQCCPGCGHFCTQGKFYQCREEGATVHYFHKQCQVLKGGKYFCPHCGEESQQFEVSLSLDEPVCENVTEEKGSRSGPARAKMTIHANSYRSFLKPEKDSSEDSVTASYKISSSDKTLSTGGIPIGPDKHALEKVITNLTEERPKKYRTLPKCLYNPAYEGDLDRVVFMLADGYNADEKYEEFDNQTALHAATINGNLPIVHLLVQAGASIHSVDKELKTPLMHAAENNHVQIVRYLIKIGADVSLRAEDGMTVLHYAAKAGHTDVIRVLLDCDNIDVNVQDDGGWTPIIWASEHKLVLAVKLLVKNGADPNLKDKEENTSLHWAAFSGSVDIAETFLNAGCELETPNEHGDRPLHIAARQDHYECVVLFLARGADVEAKNNENEQPIQCCLDENSPVWLALRVNKQLKGFAANRLGQTERLVHRDVSMGRENIPIAVVNSIDDDQLPEDFQYITENTETTDLNINRTISSLQSCRCQDDCSSMFCVCGRNSVKCWYDRGCRLLPEFNMLEPPLIFECNKGCRCWSTCNNRVVQNGIVSRLQMFKTKGRGWGVKSLLDIAKGMFICEYIGELISDSEADSREDDSYLFDLDNRDGDTYCIDARKYGNISRFINHRCEPNLIPVKVFVDHQDLRFPRICFFSSREIKAHEELGFDYGEKFWMIKWKQFTCACGSEKCKYSSETINKTLEDYRQRHEDEGVVE